MTKQAVIIGAGPAGLTAAYELLVKSDYIPVIIEASGDIGGIARTVNYKNNLMDIGPHRFFSKSDRVLNFWFNILPLQTKPSKDDILLDRKISFPKNPIERDPQTQDDVMLTRNRLTRIFFLRKFFDYPVSLSFNTMKNLGAVRLLKSGVSYLYSLFVKREENSLEDFMINRFGKELYLTFFKDYTEKVWGVHPAKIPADWGRQRIKGLSVKKVISEALKKIFSGGKDENSDKNVETSLIKSFYYPKYGSGHFWQSLAKKIVDKGGKIIFHQSVYALETKDNQVVKVLAKDESGKIHEYEGDYFMSSMPVKDLITAFDKKDEETARVAESLKYRDFMTVGLLMKKLEITNNTSIPSYNNIIPDVWIYVQERDVKIGRFQVINNWSPYMLDDYENTVYIGLEYFCNEGGELWSMGEKEFIDFAIAELEKINIIKRENVLGSHLVKVPKAYPAYFGAYEEFNVIRKFTDGYENLFLMGRNGMHKYNNMDHSMITAMEAAGNIIKGVKTKDNIWKVNAESDYHEEK
jgi:protoporphyrinogen oxidase